MGVLIKNARVLTQDRKRNFLTGADILVKENEIERVQKNMREKAEFTIDASHKLVLPGLVNSHTHLAMTLFRGYADDMVLEKWLSEKIWPLEKKLRAGDVYSGSMLGCAEMIRSGATSFADMYFFMDEAARAVRDSGMRASLSYGMFDFGDPEKREKELAIANDFVSGHHNTAGGRVLCSLGPHAIYTCSAEMLLKAKELARKRKMKIQIHVSETRKEVYDIMKSHRKRPVEYLDKIGFLGDDVVAAHCGWVSAREIKLLAERGVSVAHCPVSNLKLATGGIAPITEMLERGVCVALGTDGAASNNTLNMFETMKLSALLQKHRLWDARALGAGLALDMATINGARALGINAGSIEKGKLADIITIDL
ncbi:MAG: amidohydrolase, partial [Candidatus Micrarchaeota archaeon]